MDVIAYLIGYTVTLNDYKQEVTTETRSQIFAKKESVSRAEFYNGGKAGLQIAPPLILTAPDGSDSAEVREIYHRKKKEE